ncbi:FIG01221169: hypothetical protein [Yersinia enterocolitica IP 10393]|nr:FIG01221169: hypothetical protein [Yersinia enterocolitica IP 10393]
MKVANDNATVIQASWAPSSGFCATEASGALNLHLHQH